MRKKCMVKLEDLATKIRSMRITRKKKSSNLRRSTRLNEKTRMRIIRKSLIFKFKKEILIYFT
ncbi:hypothetical protein BpHYR1_009490 [Brachionus plicatilis]|uniref:Uncharacterized protein n=1 Tax=Brachionus plicatilis TaxID=10195 RepID=A0A3M7S009_BRAPC|nr:hypothetical protein BpHYR1_009490 [Brachionus plicatilis]